MMIAIARAVIRFITLMLLTFQSATQFFIEAGMRIKAVWALDFVLNTFFFEQLGTGNGVFVLTLASFCLSWLAYLRGIRTRSIWA